MSATEILELSLIQIASISRPTWECSGAYPGHCVLNEFGCLTEEGRIYSLQIVPLSCNRRRGQMLGYRSRSSQRNHPPRPLSLEYICHLVAQRSPGSIFPGAFPCCISFGVCIHHLSVKVMSTRIGLVETSGSSTVRHCLLHPVVALAMRYSP